MNRDKVVLNYEDLESDLKLEIIGLEFNIGITKDLKERLENLQDKFSKMNDEEIIKNTINELLDENAYIKIKDKFKKDTGKEIDEIMWVKIVMFIKEQIDNYTKGLQKETNNQNKYNREYRRNSRYRRNRQNYRRY